MTKEIKKYLADENATLKYAKNLARLFKEPGVIFLRGELGAGKTTFTRGFLQGLGYEGKVKSPTYTLVESYEFDTYFLFHFDLYRINDPHELEYIGIQDYFLPHAICLIEWPEKGEGILPKADIVCYLKQEKQGREITLMANSNHGETILERLSNEK